MKKSVTLFQQNLTALSLWMLQKHLQLGWGKSFDQPSPQSLIWAANTQRYMLSIKPFVLTQDNATCTSTGL